MNTNINYNLFDIIISNEKILDNDNNNIYIVNWLITYNNNKIKKQSFFCNKCGNYILIDSKLSNNNIICKC